MIRKFIVVLPFLLRDRSFHFFILTERLLFYNGLFIELNQFKFPVIYFLSLSLMFWQGLIYSRLASNCVAEAAFEFLVLLSVHHHTWCAEA